MTSQPGPMVTREELAVLFRVDRQTISNWVRNKRLPPPVRVGRKLLWRHETVDRFLSALEGPARA